MARPDSEGIATVRAYLAHPRTYEENVAFNEGVRASQFYIGAWADSEDVPPEIRAVLERLFNGLFNKVGIPSASFSKPKQIGDNRTAEAAE